MRRGRCPHRPGKLHRFYGNFRRIRNFSWVDVGIDPYGPRWRFRAGTKKPLHLLGRAEAEQVDARLEHPAREIHQRDVAGFLLLVRLGDDLHVVVELVGRARELVDIRADLIRRGVFVARGQAVRKAGEDKHEVLLLAAFGREELAVRRAAVVFGQNRLDANDGI